jgi:hypothetical protein
MNTRKSGGQDVPSGLKVDGSRLASKVEQSAFRHSQHGNQIT